MQVLNKPNAKSAFEEQTGIPLIKKPKVVEEEPVDLCGFAFSYKGKLLKLFQFSAGLFVAYSPGSHNRWNDGVIHRGSFEEDMNKHYPEWKPL